MAVLALAADDIAPTQCRLSGRVADAVTGERVKKAQVTLSDTGSDNAYAAATDESGAFLFTSIPGGTYELVVQKRGFVQTGKVLTLKDGQTNSGEIIRLIPQGVVTGRVADRSGDPIDGATVQAIQSHSMGSGQRYSVVASAMTNDLGEYRIYGLNPGRYYLAAAYRGGSGYGAAYFPDAREANRAVPIDVPAAGEVHGLNVTIGETHSVKIRGTIRGTAELPVRGIMIVAAPCDAGPLNRATTTVENEAGVFELRNLPPGCYVLAADSFRGGRRFSARLPVTVAEKNIEDVRLALMPPLQLTGRARLEGAADFPFQKVIVNLEARFSKLTAGGAAAADGSLVLNNVVPEIYELNVTVPDGYYLKSARIGESDVLRSGLDLSHGVPGGLELEIGGDGGEIDGVAIDGKDQPVEGVRVALVAKEPGGWPRAKVAVSGAKGNFRFRGIAPGEYRIYGAENLDVSALGDPAYGSPLGAQARAVSIRPHGAEQLQVKVAPAR